MNIKQELIKVSNFIAKKDYELVVLDEDAVKKNTSLWDAKVVMEGTREKIESFAKKNKLEWKSKKDYLFGGYWIADNGDAYIAI